MTRSSRGLRLGLAQLNPIVGDLAGNSEAIASAYAQAEAVGCDVVAFGELSVTGYPPEDLVLKPGFVRDNQAALQTLAAQTGRCVAVIGFVDSGEGVVPATGRPVLYNAAAVCANGMVHGIYRKRLLPNYDVFDEDRTFQPGTGSHQLYDINGVRVGITICEDIWFADGPVAEQAAGGAEINININGSPYHRGKIHERQQMLSTRALETNCPIVYVNQVGGQDELVFGGEVVARLAQFSTELMFVDFEIPERDISKTLPVISVNKDLVASRYFAELQPRIAPQRQ
ncbi:MAG: synthetase, partial [Actinomycetota bacterium]